MDSELLRRLKLRREKVDSSASAYGEEDTSLRQNDQKAPVTTEDLSSKRKAFTSASLRGYVPDRGSVSTSSAYPSAPSFRKKTEGGGNSDELSKRLQARRGVVDSEGTTWEKLAEASIADACVGGGLRLHHNAESDLPGHFLDARLESALRQNLILQMEELRRDEHSVLGSDTHAGALAECLHAGEALPWDVLRRGVQTWVCNVWVSEPVCSNLQACRKNTSNSPMSGSEETLEVLATPAILCLASDGELRVCVSVHPPADVSEEADYAKLLNAFEVSSLQQICSVANMPEVLFFYFTRSACGGLYISDTPESCGNPTSLAPSLVARFESDDEAESCALALSNFSVAPLVEETPTGSTGVLLTRLFGDAEIETAPEVGVETFIDGDGECSASDWRSSVKASVGLKAFMTDTHAFLQELDRLAGFV